MFFLQKAFTILEFSSVAITMGKDTVLRDPEIVYPEKLEILSSKAAFTQVWKVFSRDNAGLSLILLRS